MNKLLLFSIIFLFVCCTDNASGEQKQYVGDFVDTGTYSPNVPDHDSSVLSTGWYFVSDNSNGYKRQLDKSGETYYLDPRPIVTAKNISSVEIFESSYKGKKHFGLTMRLDSEGTEIWSVATRKAEITGERLAFVLDNKLLQVSKVLSQITDGSTALLGHYSRRELERFKRIIDHEK